MVNSTLLIRIIYAFKNGKNSDRVESKDTYLYFSWNSCMFIKFGRVWEWR